MSKEAPKQKNWFARHRVWTVIIVLVVISLFASGASGDKSNTASTTPAASPTPSASAEASPEPKKPDVPAEYTSALSQGNSYANRMNMSKQGVYDQLTSQYGGKFSAEAAQYAIDNVKADWNANALASAKDYQNKMSMSPAAIHDQLTSSFGAKFTPAEADYAIAHLND